MAVLQLAGGLKTADAGHLDVHENDVWLEFANFLQGFLARLGFTDHVQATDISQHAGNACANQIVVIDHQNTNHTSPRLHASRHPCSGLVRNARRAVACRSGSPATGAGRANMAEAVRFELTEEFPLRRFSRPLHSTALPRFRRLRAAILPERNTLSNSLYWLVICLCYDRV